MRKVTIIKSIHKYSTALLVLGVLLSSCAKHEIENIPASKSNNEDFFYYGSNEKIYLTQIMDKVFLRFASDANVEQIRSIVDNATAASMQLMDDVYWDLGNYRYAGLESKDGKPISPTLIESLKANPRIASVEYLYLSKQSLPFSNKFIGIMDDFLVKLKGSTSIERLEQLAKQNNCNLELINELIRDPLVYLLHVPKSSKLNSMQMANVFYETGLFEFSVPVLAHLNCIDNNFIPL